MRMYISHLQVSNFRSYESLEMDFCEGVNCLSGPNGTGKTNVLDALHYLSLTRGLRSHKDSYALREGERFFLISAKIAEEKHHWEVQCNFIKGKGKKILHRGKPLDKMSKHIGRIPLVASLPGDTALITGASVERRRLVDMLISQYSPSYLSHLIHYNHILSQRNALLKQMAEARAWDTEQIELWDAQLAPHGLAIQTERMRFLEAFLPLFQTFYKKIASQTEAPSITYKSNIEEASLNGWIEQLRANGLKDLAIGHTTLGIHRDDLVFHIDGQAARHYGSQGQQKTFVIALRLAQHQLLQKQMAKAPILLLDDIFDRLDEHRLHAIAKLLKYELTGQVFVTDTSEDRLHDLFEGDSNRPYTHYLVQKGRVKEKRSP